MKNHIQGRRFVLSDQVKAASPEVAKTASSCSSRSYTNVGRSLSSPKGTTLKVDVLWYHELLRVRFSTPCPQTFGSYYV
ncbi:hypothetical protein TNCV_724891 [Trichonephila clavipes]|nr:hypothetical protein TNCV_724891 [Trichonephila clavipes]